MPGGPACGGDIDAPGDDLSQGQYFVETNKSPLINLRFVALFDLIVCCTTKMGFLIPSSRDGRDLDAIFAEKVPKVNLAKNYKPEREKWLVGAEILAYLKYLIYSAAFKDPIADPRGSIHVEFSEAGTEHFASMKSLSAEKCRSSWSAGMPSIHTGRESGVSYPRTKTITLEVLMKSISQSSRFIMMMLNQ